MLGLGQSFAASFVAAMLLTSGISHALGFSVFQQTVSSHRGWAYRFATPVCLSVTMFELICGSLMVSFLIFDRMSLAWRISGFGVCAGMAAAFAFYVSALLQNSERPRTCGCTPVSGPLTRLSIAPSTALICVCVIGLVSDGSMDPMLTPLSTAWHALASAWGITMSGLIMLLPASAPRGSEWNE